MEVNATEKVFHLVDGTAKTFYATPSDNSLLAEVPVQFVNGKVVNSSAMLHEYKSAAQCLHAAGVKVSTISKARMGILKNVTNWRRERKTRVVRSSSVGHRHSSSDRPKSVDPLAPLLLHGQSCTSSTRQDADADELRFSKPRNYRRVVVLGAPRVGKTAILRRFLQGGFEDNYIPTTEDFHSKLYHIRGETYQIDILDASNERDFPAKRRLSILTGDIFLLVFSVDDRQSFNEVCSLRTEIKLAKSKLGKSKENTQVPIVICGNKVDLQAKRVVSRPEMCERLGEDAAVFETSAKDGTQMEKMFEALAQLGGLPVETRPSLHRDISIRSYEALHGGKRSKREIRLLALDGPCGAVYPLARRPSYHSDLRRILGPSASKRTTPIERCQIQ
ncbi:hypothetical protein AALO_G00075070 [Alosa alosa]|uniref:Small monomeric GTPase n=1 Tax=Alosa alosa TaxID=278164 RepID=A0AAV6GWB9_9TELE|nr:GTP-binding protein Rhes [Alosa alosa]KAG5279190.1 hypothetical protein AALO_G00075070 [Alosa alosa]